MTTKTHKADDGNLILVNMKWTTDGRPNPIYKCQICGTILDSTQHVEYKDN